MKYWNPYLETLSRERLLELELNSFRKLFQYAKEHSPFYCQRYKDIVPEDIETKEDLKRLTHLDKEDLRAAQEGTAQSLYGEILGVGPENVTTFRQTSGTTGKSVCVPEMYESWQWRVEVWRHILWMAGFRETDRVLVPFGYNVCVAFWDASPALTTLMRGGTA